MSEFSSFYLQIHIEEDSLQKSLAKPSKNLSDYEDWKDWFLLKQRLHEDSITFLDKYAYSFSDSMADRVEKMVEHSFYDSSKKLYVLDNINIGESFEVFMQYMIVFRGLSDDMILDSKENFMVIYPFWWGDRECVNDFADVYIEFQNRNSLLMDVIDKRNMEIAIHYFGEHADDFAREFYDKYGSFE